MNNYCRNCGEKLDNNTKICPKCNAEVFETRVNVEQKKNEIKEYKKKENKYIIIVITLYALSFLTPYLKSLGEYNFISFISPLLPLGAVITLIYARITMNKSKKIRIMFNIFMVLIILYLLFIVFIFITCTGALNRGCY